MIIRALFYPLITANKSRLAAGLRGVSVVSSGQTKYSRINYVIKHRQKPRELIPTPLAIMLMAAGITSDVWRLQFKRKFPGMTILLLLKRFQAMLHLLFFLMGTNTQTFAFKMQMLLILRSAKSV